LTATAAGRTISPAMVSDLDALLRSLEPALHEGAYVFTSVPSGQPPPETCVATFREAEGLTLVLPEEDALRLGLPVLFRAAWITLTVHSELAAVGLTAAFAAALTEANISCNVIAAVHHDHIFVPVERAADAMGALRALQSGRAKQQEQTPR
jgi:uncharacterized protein